MMRIITGTAKGIKLKTPEGESTRPTSERIKEAVFSSIHFDVEGRRVLDLFAGSGQMGLEALSRGAASAMFVDSSAEAIACVKENAKKTSFFEQSRFLISDYRNYIRKAGENDRYNLIFVDPPYAPGVCADAIRRVVASSLADAGAIFVVESEGDEEIFASDASLASLFETLKATHYGKKTQINILLYKGNA